MKIDDLKKLNKLFNPTVFEGQVRCIQQLLSKSILNAKQTIKVKVKKGEEPKENIQQATSPLLPLRTATTIPHFLIPRSSIDIIPPPPEVKLEIPVSLNQNHTFRHFFYVGKKIPNIGTHDDQQKLSTSTPEDSVVVSPNLQAKKSQVWYSINLSLVVLG